MLTPAEKKSFHCAFDIFFLSSTFWTCEQLMRGRRNETSPSLEILLLYFLSKFFIS